MAGRDYSRWDDGSSVTKVEISEKNQAAAVYSGAAGEEESETGKYEDDEQSDVVQHRLV